MSIPGALPAVVTGQQAGLLGGPLFTLGKLLGAVAIARSRGERALFWVECDDADIVEVDQASIVAADGEVETLRVGAPDDGRPVAARILDDGIEALLARLESRLAPGPGSASALADLHEFWRPGARWHEAFQGYLGRLTSGLEVGFVDPSRGEIKQAAAPLLRRVLTGANAVEAAIATGTAKQARPQVPYIEGELPLFLLDTAGVRRKLERRDGGFALKGSDLRLTLREILELLEREPERFSPGVLLRPLVQDFVLPTTVYVAGPSESAYHAQLGELYSLLEVERPTLVPRPRFALIEARTRRLLEKLALPLEVALAGEAEVAARLATAATGIDPAAATADTARAVETELATLAGQLVPLDPGALGPAFTEASSKIAYQIGKLGTRALDAMKRHNADASRQAHKLGALLTPLGKPQERVLCPVHFLARIRREELIEHLLGAIDPADPGRLVTLELGGAASA